MTRFKPAVGVAVLVAAGAVYAFVPRTADLRHFNPAGVARLETDMWRHYYERSYPSLVRCLYSLYRNEYRFSPWDSGKLAWHAAQAARRFQTTRSRAEAMDALPALERHYAILARSRESFDPRRAARLELEWWQLRRENATPEMYGNAVSQVAAEVYGMSEETLRESARLRAKMMAYRDERRDGRMSEDDWTFIETNLGRAYELLKAAVNAPVESARNHRESMIHPPSARRAAG